MNKIKDFIYDKNDLLIALLIVIAAAFIITSGVDEIMAYPETHAGEAVVAGGDDISLVPQKPAEPSHSPDDEATTTDGPEDQEAGSAKPNDGSSGSEAGEQGTGEQPVVPVSIYIEYGATGSEIAQLLIDSGLIDNKEAFYDAVAAAGADTRLQAGTFKIPANATPAEIIKIITN
jgi:hypothetical protein